MGFHVKPIQTLSETGNFRAWMTATSLLFCVLLSVTLLGCQADSGGGIECAACAVVTSLLEQLAVVNNQTVDEVLDDICLLFPPEFAQICVYFVDTYGAEVVRLFEEEYNPDEICHELAFCTDPTCALWAPTGRQLRKPKAKFINLQEQRRKRRGTQSTPWDWILELLAPLIDKSEPVLDFDADLYSDEVTLRGTSWRGKDCSDFDSTVHPGRAVTTHPPTFDHNCNGIFAKNGQDYEKMFCEGSGQMGVAIIGDSAGAHFSIPPDYMNASAIDESTFSDLLFVLSNEFDWPQRSALTGHTNSTPSVHISSIYQKLKERNRCNHRDYQNICRNGLRSGSAVDLSKTLARNASLDQPVLLTYELIGNDVCSGHHDFSHFTDLGVFRQNLLEVLGNFSLVLPKGSHVVFVGLAPGGVLYELMHNHTHPIGATYTQVYDFLNCLEISPCWAWMNSNDTVRKIGDDWAQKLSAIYGEVIATHSYPNFDMAYYPFPIQEIFNIWKGQGGEPWRLIEPIDGFHPNQNFNWLLADWLWEALEKDHPTFLGKENPHNGEIWSIFGDQGGY